MKSALFNILASLGSCALVGELPGADEPIYYERHVRPILKTHCFQCHGEGGELKGGLDLRLARLIGRGGKNGSVVQNGDRAASRLYDLIHTGKMPPERATISESEIELIGRWIDQGARTLRPEDSGLDPDEYITDEEREFWAFRPIAKSRVPEMEGRVQPVNPLDAFVGQKLAAVGLGFSEEAPRATLIRRAFFDLTGLPPTPEELDSARSIPFEAMLDRLLDSPHYGERWGRHWLDVAGYADSEGYAEEDAERLWAWRYRDWVIRAFNEDMPFDRFVTEQLAGDESVPQPYKDLSEEAISRLTATGFLRMVPDGTGSRGVDQAAARNQVVAETVQVVASAFLGLTVDCARCHDHRYDPISQRDYYRLRAIFEPALNPQNWKTPSGRAVSLYTDEDRRLAAEIEAKAKEVDAKRQQKIEFFIDRTLKWKLKAIPDPSREALRRAYKKAEKDRTDQEKDLLKAHPSIRNISAGSLYLYDREYRVEVARLKAERAALLKGLLEKARGKSGNTLVEADLIKLAPEGASELRRLDESIQYYLDTMSEKVLKDLASEAKVIRGTKPEEQFVRALSEPSGKAPVTLLFHRGDHEQPKESVLPAELTVVALPKNPIPENDPHLPGTGRRSAFAKRLTDGAHPLTARVIVNRVWMHHFGYGLVRTPEDFGRLGDRPTHPELLDWLAWDFVSHGWRLKRLHRLIMSSDTWKQSSKRKDALDREDPDNLLLGRMNVRRLEAEAIRDGMLAVSGALKRELFGRPVPVMEDEVGQIVIGRENLDGERKPGKAVDLNGQEFRRGIYVQARRSRMLSMLGAFDSPDMEPNCSRRSVSTVAQQALVFMNGEFAIDQAKRMADRVVALVKEDRARQVDVVWNMALARNPTEAETRRATAFLDEQFEVFAKARNPEPARSALAGLCQALMSSNEFLYVD
jgi:mono/diheme cytochrome c family protein